MTLVLAETLPDDALQDILAFLPVSERLCTFSRVCRRWRDVAALDIQPGVRADGTLVAVHAVVDPVVGVVPGMQWTPKGYPYTFCRLPGPASPPLENLYTAARAGDATVFCTLWRALPWTADQGDTCWDIVSFETLWQRQVDVDHVRAILAFLCSGGDNHARAWRHGLVCLKAACIKGLTEIVRFFVDDAGVPADVLDGTLLYLTVPQHPDTAVFLASRGADITRSQEWAVRTLRAQGCVVEAARIQEAWVVSRSGNDGHNAKT